MKKTFKSLLSLFLAVFMVASLIVIPSSAASLSKTTLNLTKGYQTTLKVTGGSSVKWSTGDKSIATVSSKGKVVGKSVGTTYIYAKTGGTTLKCKVNVVPSKITASNSDVTLDEKGDSQIVTLTVKGSHSGLTVGTTNKKVASASWVKTVEWDGDKIKIKITAKGDGEAKIKVYLKKYSKTCYKYINVTVGDSLYEEDDPNSSDSDMTILPYSQNVEVNTGSTANLQVYCSDINNLAYNVNNSKIATVSAGSTTGNGKYRNFVIKGVAAGSTTVRFYDKNDKNRYVDVTVKVSGASARYYEISETKPEKIASTDKILTVQVNTYTNYYMLVPADYDPAQSNTIIAERFGKYQYYEVYNAIPTRINANDTYREFTHTNSKYTYGRRYVLLPANFDEVKLNTAIAKYNEWYEYYTVYNEKPALQNAWDEIKTWTVIDSTTGRSATRYMVVPFRNADQDRIDEIMKNDMNSSNVYLYYTAYDVMPVVNSATEDLIWYTKNGQWRYMVVPKENFDILERNEAIKNDTGVYEAYVMYKTSPTADASKGEYVITATYGRKKVYVLCKYEQNSTAHKNAWATIYTAAPAGT